MAELVAVKNAVLVYRYPVKTPAVILLGTILRVNFLIAPIIFVEADLAEVM